MMAEQSSLFGWCWKHFIRMISLETTVKKHKNGKVIGLQLNSIETPETPDIETLESLCQSYLFRNNVKQVLILFSTLSFFIPKIDCSKQSIFGSVFFCAIFVVLFIEHPNLAHLFMAFLFLQQTGVIHPWRTQINQFSSIVENWKPWQLIDFFVQIFLHSI